MKTIRTMLVDDEPFARQRLRRLLDSVSYIQVVAEAKNGQEALELLQKYQPDLLFLDIQMPGLNGIELMVEHQLEPAPQVVFVTAYDQYAIKAFDLQAVDYLLKPFDDERFHQALEQAVQQINLREKALQHEKILQVIHAHQSPQKEIKEAIEIKEKGRSYFVPIVDILWVQSDGNYLRLFTEQKTYLIRETLQSFISSVSEQQFLRIHRSIIVQKIHIVSVQYLGNNQYQFKMKNEEVLQSSRSNKPEIAEYLNEEQLRKNI